MRETCPAEYYGRLAFRLIIIRVLRPRWKSSMTYMLSRKLCIKSTYVLFRLPGTSFINVGLQRW